MWCARHWSWIALAAAAALAAGALAESGAPARAVEGKPLLRNAATTVTQAPARPGLTGPGAWVRTTGALAAVVALIVLLAWGYRRAAGLPVGVLRGRNLGLIEIVSRASLTPRVSLWLVSVGPRLVLVGGGAEGLRPLDVITDANVVASLLGEAAERRADSSVAAFSAALADEAKQYTREDEAPQSPGLPRLDAARAKLARALERLQGAAPT